MSKVYDWEIVAKSYLDDLREAISPGYKQSRYFQSYQFNMLPKKVRTILDFGCGIGRNFSRLKVHCDRLIGFDIPAMVEACQLHTDNEDVEVTSDWEAVVSQHYGLVVACNTLHHIHDEVLLRKYLRDLTLCASSLYVISSLYMAKSAHNLLEILKEQGWLFNHGNYEEGDTEFEIVFRPQRSAVFGIETDGIYPPPPVTPFVVPEVSIVIPTYQPDKVLLDLCLQAVTKQEAISAGSYEVLVVENPVETTVGRSLAVQYGVRHEVCSETGANAARNYGTQKARGKIIGLMDDDVAPMPTWVSKTMSLHSFFPHVGIIGGKLLLRYLADRPKWIDGAFLLWLSQVDWPANGFTDLFGKSLHIVSGNMSYRKEKWEKVGGFPAWAGLRGREVLTVNDELSFTQACGEIGNPQIGYDPLLVAWHLIPQQRLTLEYMRARAYGQGYADGRDWVRLHYEDRNVDDIYYHHIQSVADNFLYYGEIDSTRQRIAHEESMRRYVRNIIICRSDYFRGILDATERDREAIWESMKQEKVNGRK